MPKTVKKSSWPSASPMVRLKAKMPTMNGPEHGTAIGAKRRP
jgi:hypothetical protein